MRGLEHMSYICYAAIKEALLVKKRLYKKETYSRQYENKVGF